MGKTHLSYCLLFGLLLFTGCEHANLPNKEEVHEDANITLSLSCANRVKSATPEGGDIFSDLSIWIADETGKVTAYISTLSSDNADNNRIQIAEDGKTASVRVANMTRGAYTVYIVANIPNSLKKTMSAYIAGSVIDDVFLGAELPAVGASLEPPFGVDYTDKCMPLSIVKDISVGAGENKFAIEMVRTCGRIRVSVQNNTIDCNLFMNHVALSQGNPTKSYLFHKSGHDLPADSQETDFIKYEVSDVTEEYIEPGQGRTFMNQFVYETGPGSMDGMVLYLRGGLFGRNVTSAKVESVERISYEASLSTASSSFNEGTPYLILNQGSTYYIYGDDNVLRGRNRPSLDLLLVQDNLKDYLWYFKNYQKVSNQDAYQCNIQNASSEFYMNIKTSLDVEMTSQAGTIHLEDTGAESTYLCYDRFKYHSNGTKYSPYYLYTKREDDERLYCMDNSSLYHNRWLFVPVQEVKVSDTHLVGTSDNAEALKDLYFNVSHLKVIDNTGQAVNLTDICRNDDLNIKVYVHYATETGLVYFEVKAWTGVSNETTFD